MTRVAVVSRSAVTRAGLETLVRAAGFELSGVYAVVDEVDTSSADVILVSAPPEEVEGAEDLPLVLLSDQDSGQTPAAFAAVLPEDASPAEIAGALHAAAAGLVVVRKDDLRRAAAAPADTSLTPRETEVLRMLADGLPNKLIAHRLGISEHTVKYHVTSILSRLNASSRAEAVAIGIRRGIILL